MNVHDIRRKQETTLVAGMRAAGADIEPPSSLDPTAMAQRAVRAVRRRRVALAVAGGMAVAVVATAGGLMVTYDALADRGVLPGSSDVAVTPSPVTPSPVATAGAEPTPEPTGPQPAVLPQGWQAAEFRGLSYAVPGSWTSTSFDDASARWSGPGQVIEVQGDETVAAGAGSIQDSLSLQANLREPHPEDRPGQTLREELVVPGAESALLTAGKDPESHTEWSQLLLHHEDGLWYSAHLEFVTDAVRPAQVTKGLADSLAFTSSAQEVRDALPSSEGLPVIEVDSSTPSDWVVHELDGLRYAVPAGMSPDPLWEDQGIQSAEGWLVPDGVQEGVSLSVTAIREYDGYGATMAPAEEASTFPIDGAGRVVVTIRESEPWHNGATPLDVQFSVLDAEMAGSWIIAATLPNTPEGERIARQILGSVRLL